MVSLPTTSLSSSASPSPPPSLSCLSNCLPVKPHCHNHCDPPFLDLFTLDISIPIFPTHQLIYSLNTTRDSNPSYLALDPALPASFWSSQSNVEPVLFASYILDLSLNTFHSTHLSSIYVIGHKIVTAGRKRPLQRESGGSKTRPTTQGVGVSKAQLGYCRG